MGTACLDGLLVFTLGSAAMVWGLVLCRLESGVQIRIKGLELPKPYEPLGLQVYKHCLHCAGKAIHAICIALFWDPRVPVSTSLTPKTRIYGFWA